MRNARESVWMQSDHFGSTAAKLVAGGIAAIALIKLYELRAEAEERVRVLNER
jgi:hypothetical protein